VKRGILLDTGPLVAFLNRQDKYHPWALAQWNQIAPPLLTCEAVLSETCFLLAQTELGSGPVLQLLQRGVLSLPFHLEGQYQAIAPLLKKYRSVPMSLADACLVRMSELFPSSQVLTLDRDFILYRRHGRQVIPALMPATAQSGSSQRG
jgi:predicted nucleic acid-binding protein